MEPFPKNQNSNRVGEMMTMDELESVYDEQALEQAKVVGEEVWKTDDYVKLFKEVLDIIVYETHHLTEGDLKYDRLLFHKQTSMVFDDDKNIKKKTHQEEIRTLATLMTQKVKNGEFFMSGFGVKDD